MKKLFLIAPALLLLACGGNTEENSENNEPNAETHEEVVNETIEEPVTETVEVESPLSSEEEIQAYLETKDWEATEAHESGMYIVIDEAGEGEERPTLNDEVTIFYQGYLLDGTKFDGTGADPATFSLFQLIQGWQIGIPMFGKGGSGKLIIPSDLAYGPNDVGDIPGGSTLLFEIALIDWHPVAM